MEATKKGLLIVVSAPAGCGKDTILKDAFAENSNLFYSVSCTTRNIRAGETDGVHYRFLSKEKFREMLADGELLEHTEYVGNYYGTPKAAVLEMLEAGKDVVLKIEVEGAGNIKKLFPECVMIFILPPSFAELERRLRKRGSETEDEIKKRISAAREEVALAKNYDYLIINGELDAAVRDFLAVVRAEKLSAPRMLPLAI